MMIQVLDLRCRERNGRAVLIHIPLQPYCLRHLLAQNQTTIVHAPSIDALSHSCLDELGLLSLANALVFLEFLDRALASPLAQIFRFDIKML